MKLFADAKETLTIASAEFTQAYKTQNYADKVINRLNFVKQGKRWKIAKEQTVVTL